MDQSFPRHSDLRLTVIGLGYVGASLSVLFGRRFDTLGFDVDGPRVDQLKAGRDRTRQVTSEELAEARHLAFTSNEEEIRGRDVYIVSVPTPVDASKRPDLEPLRWASRIVGRAIGRGAVVVFESTVYPGATEEDCVPVIERESGLEAGRDFHVGYSPERVNPGDPAHGIADIVKVTSGSTPEAAAFVDGLYAEVIRAGTHRAPSIRVAEAAKVIENTQRDVNIALVNELAILFERLGIDTTDVLEAAGTKWNFLPFRPGLVGGHCVGVDPYYLTHKAQSVGHHPDMILAGRRTNDGMGRYVAERLVRLMARRQLIRDDSRVLVLGATFKENCPDLRNSQVREILHGLRSFNLAVDLNDPWADPEEVAREFDVTPIPEPDPGRYDAVLMAVAHREYLEKGVDWVRSLGRADSVVFDLPSAFARRESDARL